MMQANAERVERSARGAGGALGALHGRNPAARDVSEDARWGSAQRRFPTGTHAPRSPGYALTQGLPIVPPAGRDSGRLGLLSFAPAGLTTTTPTTQRRPLEITCTRTLRGGTGQYAVRRIARAGFVLRCAAQDALCGTPRAALLCASWPYVRQATEEASG
jgi:hypothetical protein